MNSWLSKSITLSLAVFYALLVSFGHALHSHGDCEVVCDTAEQVCSCGHHHEPADTSDDSADTSGWRAASNDDCCDDCAACELMSHLKAAHHSIELLSVTSTLACECTTEYQAPLCSSSHEAWAPRGPPLAFSA
ncbi:hypothetical protein [Aeoliella sp. SH292]|uniref:hypothetical protein n=1 Tax=Aeoliella sp. SH292 TaxID=3454464 RepID=UPI003F9BE736